MEKVRKVVGVPGSLRLYVIAGLQQNITPGVRDQLQKKFSADKIQIIAVRSGNDDHNLYNHGTVDTLLRTTAEFAVRRLNKSLKKNLPEVPGRIVLFYIPSNDDEYLLTQFDHFAYPVPLQPNTQHGKRDIRWRADFDMALRIVSDAINNLTKANLPGPELPCNDITMLPPKNFRPDQDELTLDQYFQRIRKSGLSFDDLRKIIKPKKFNNSELPKVLGSVKAKYFYVDHRGIVFPPSKSGSGDHALPRQIPGEAGINEIRRLMNQLFRFGVPLRPGFHHDAQYPDDKPLEGNQFHCSVQGSVKVYGTHANVYPNDMVRAERLETKKGA
ncbi:MAG: hypothetical protein WCF85_02985 [Rhodospirillaceae bacterium]